MSRSIMHALYFVPSDDILKLKKYRTISSIYVFFLFQASVLYITDPNYISFGRVLKTGQCVEFVRLSNGPTQKMKIKKINRAYIYLKASNQNWKNTNGNSEISRNPVSYACKTVGLWSTFRTYKMLDTQRSRVTLAFVSMNWLTIDLSQYR